MLRLCWKLSCVHPSVQTLVNSFSRPISPICSTLQTKYTGLQHIHTHQPLLSPLDRDVHDRKQIIKSAQDSKLEGEVKGSDAIEIGIDGSDHSGTCIPTMETMSMMIDGVRFDRLPVVHIKSSPNNTIMSLTDHTGTDIMAVDSCGLQGFRNAKKSTTVAAQATGYSMGLKTKKKGILNVRVKIKGLGSGRMPCMKGVSLAGINIVSITDITPVIHSGRRPRKAKRN